MSACHQPWAQTSLRVKHLSQLPWDLKPHCFFQTHWEETLLEARAEPHGGQGAAARPSGCPRPSQPDRGRQRAAAATPRRGAQPAAGPAAASRICCSRQPIGAGAGDGATSFIHKKKKKRRRGAAQLGSAPFQAGRGAGPRPRLPAPPCRGSDTHGNPLRRCYPNSRRPRRISRWRGCTARSGTGTGPPRTPWRRLRDTGPRLGQRGALPRRGHPGAAPRPGPGRARDGQGAGSRRPRVGAGLARAEGLGAGRGRRASAGGRRWSRSCFVRGIKGPFPCFPALF